MYEDQDPEQIVDDFAARYNLNYATKKKVLDEVYFQIESKKVNYSSGY